MRVNVGVCLAAALMALACASGALADQASKLYKEGRKAERAGAMAGPPPVLPSRRPGPQEEHLWLRSQAVRTRAALQSKITLPASDADPGGRRFPTNRTNQSRAGNFAKPGNRSRPPNCRPFPAQGLRPESSAQAGFRSGWAQPSGWMWSSTADYPKTACCRRPPHGPGRLPRGLARTWKAATFLFRHSARSETVPGSKDTQQKETMWSPR